MKANKDDNIIRAVIVIVLACAFIFMALTLTGFKQIEQTNKINGKGKGKTFMGGYKFSSILGNDLHRISISDAEFEMMCACVMSEAGGEPYEAQEAVAQTILNRWLCEDKFPDDIIGVIQSPGQYTTTKEEPTVSVRLAVRNAIEYYNTEFMNYPKSMYYFRDSQYHNFGIRYCQIGNLYFSLAEDATD